MSKNSSCFPQKRREEQESALRAADHPGHFRAANRAGTLQRGLTVLHGNLVSVVHVTLRFTLHTIRLVGHSKPPSNQSNKTSYV